MSVKGTTYVTSSNVYEVQLHGATVVMATHSSTLIWRIPWTEESNGLQSMGSQSQTILK